MTALLYYSISSDLTEDEIIEIDIQVAKNRETVCIFLRNLASNGKDKTKRVILIIALASIVWFSNLESAEAIGLPMPPPPVVRVIPSFEDSLKKPEFAKLIPRKPERISYKYFSRSKEELLLLVYATDPRLASNQQILRIVNQVRGGSGDWSLFSFLLALGIAIVILSASAAREAFIAPPPAGWGLNDRNPFQPPGGKLNYPPAYNLLEPRRTCFADRPGFMMSQLPKSTREELTQLSTDVVKTQTQMSGFVKNGKVDLDKCLDEVNRRASEIGCTDFECSLERFKALATENGKLTSGTAREAITILQGEMHGHYENARREDYGLNVKGPDFVVAGLGKFENITHVEVKNPVGSAIKIANGQKGSIYKQGKKIGAKIVYQQNYWSNTTKTSELENLNPTASLPQSPNNVLGVVDNFDVPSSEKALMEGSVLKGSQNNTNIIFLNNN